jgi:hypothetical protein
MIALDILVRPSRAWERLRAGDPDWRASILRHALPLSLLPALAWPSEQAAPLRFGVVGTAVLILTSVLLLALSFYALAPAFGATRHWGRSVAVAAYASTPAMLRPAPRRPRPQRPGGGGTAPFVCSLLSRAATGARLPGARCGHVCRDGMRPHRLQQRGRGWIVRCGRIDLADRGKLPVSRRER